MRYLFLILTITFLSGCSLIPKINFDTPNIVPQQTDKSKMKDVCKGKAQFNENGDIIFCSKGYYAYTQNYDKKERRMTIVERIKSFINNLSSSLFWIFLLLFIFTPGVFGWLLSKILDSSRKALHETIRAIKKFRQTSNAKEELDNFLRAEHSTKTKKIISLKRNEI